VLNATIQHRSPEAVGLVNRLLEPTSRQTLGVAMQARLTGLVSAGLHNAYWLAVAMSVVTLLLVLQLPARLSPAQQTLR
jgi:hypothetical protein